MTPRVLAAVKLRAEAANVHKSSAVTSTAVRAWKSVRRPPSSPNPTNHRDESDADPHSRTQ